jgi:hypothetical protein
MNVVCALASEYSSIVRKNWFDKKYRELTHYLYKTFCKMICCLLGETLQLFASKFEKIGRTISVEIIYYVLLYPEAAMILIKHIFVPYPCITARWIGLRGKVIQSNLRSRV